MLFAQTSPTDVPVIPGLSPHLQFIIYMAGLLIPLLVSAFKWWQTGKTLNSVIMGAEKGADGAVKFARTLAEKAARGEPITEEDLKKVGAVFKTGIHEVAVVDGTEGLLAPRVEKITEHLDPSELRKRLGSLLIAFALLSGMGCSSISNKHVLDLKKAISNERQAVVVRPGFEVVVKASRDAQDELLDKMDKATK